MFEEGDRVNKAIPVTATTRFSALDLSQLQAAKPVAAAAALKPAAAAAAAALKPAAAAAAAPKPAAAAAAPKPAAAPPAGISSEVTALEAAIAAQGKLVAELKAPGAAASEADKKQAVDKLLELKNQLPEGHALRPVARSDKKKQDKAAGKAAAPTSSTAVEPKPAKAAPEEDAALLAMEQAKVDQLCGMRSERFGVHAMHQSRAEDKQGRVFTLVGDVEAKVGSKVLIRGYVHAVKSPASASFVVVRQRLHTVQCVVEGADAELKAFVDKVPVESVVDVMGVVGFSTSPHGWTDGRRCWFCR
jgi:hypothetical protein